MKKALSFLLALVMVLSVLPFGMFAAQEVSAAAPEAAKVTLTVAPVSPHLEKVKETGDYVLRAKLLLSTDKAFTLGSLQFTAEPADGVTLSYESAGAQRPLSMAAEMAGENPTGKVLFTWLFDKATADAPSTELAMSADTSYDLGTIVLTGGETLSFQDVKLEGVLAGVFDSDETNGTVYDLEVKQAEAYTRGGHGDEATTWIPLDATAAAALECDKNGDNIVDNGHYYLTEDVFIKAGEQTGFKNKTFTICLNGHNLKGIGNARLFRIESGVNMTICDCQKKGTISNPKDGKGFAGADGNLIALVSGASTLTLQDVKLDGLNMEDGTTANGGGALYVIGAGSTMTIEDCEISGFAHKVRGGAICVIAKTNLTINNVTFKDNTTAGDGGAIAISYKTGASSEGSNVDITNVTFEQNTAKRGGAVFMDRKCTLNITDSTFKNNSATDYDGAVFGEYGTTTMTRCTLTGNTCSGGGPAAAHVANSGTMKLYDCVITGNSRTSTTSKCRSGALQVRAKSSYLYVGGTTVIRHNTDADGKERNVTFNVDFDATDKKNVLHVDGLTAGANITIDTINDSGTALVRDDANTLVSATDKQTGWNELWVSYAQKDGARVGRTTDGFVYLAHSHADMADAQWQAWGDTEAERKTLPTTTGNYYLVTDINLTDKASMGTDKAGANVVICLNGHDVRGKTNDSEYRMWQINAGKVTVCDCTATKDAQGNLKAGTLYPGNGKQGYLAGLYINGNDPKAIEFTLKDVIVDGESATRTTPAIEVSYYNKPAAATGTVTVANISGCEFKNFVTTSDSGTIYVYANNKLNVTDTKFVNNKANRASAIGSAGGVVVVKNSVFENNQSTKAGSGTYPDYFGGGAIFATDKEISSVTNAHSLNVEDCTFKNNSAVTSGGAIYAYKGTTTVTDSIFTGNTAKGNLGGALMSDQSKVTITGCTFTDNTAKNNGGAIRLSGCSSTGSEVKTSKFTGNESSLGTGIYISDSSGGGAKITSCEFTNNAASKHAVAFVQSGKVTVKDSTFTGNTAEQATGASAVYNEGSSTLTLDSCTITGNKFVGATCTTYKAAAVYTSQSSALVLSGSNVVDNNVNVENEEYNLYICNTTTTSTVADKHYLNVNGVTAGTKVSVVTDDNRATADKLVKLATGGTQTSWDKSWVTYENNGKAVDRVDGVFVFAETPVAVVNGQSFDAVDTALAQAATNNGTVKLLAEVNSTVTVPAGAQIQLDLNNEKLGANAKFTSTGAATLLLADSTKSYDDAEPVKVAKSAIGANVDVADAYKVGNSRYVAVENGDFYEVHRVQAASVAKTLRTATNGIGFKLKFAAQKSLTDDVTGFGVKFQVKQGDSVVGERTVDLTKDYDKTMVNGQELVIVINEILVENGKDNAVNAGYTIEGTPFIKIGDGTVVANGLTLSASYKDMVEYAAGDAFWATATNAQKAGLAKMYGQFGSIMTNWNIQNIVNYYNNPTQQ